MELRGDQPASLEDQPLRSEPKELAQLNNLSVTEQEKYMDKVWDRCYKNISKENKIGWMKKVGFLKLDGGKDLTPKTALQYLKSAWKSGKLTKPHIMRISDSAETVAMYGLFHVPQRQISWPGIECLYNPYCPTCFMDLTVFTYYRRR
jgi:hypothetical protein